MNINVEKRENNLYITVTCGPKRHGGDKTAFNTTNLVNWLKDTNQEHYTSSAKLIRAPSGGGICNFLGEGHRTGVWIFSLETPKEVLEKTPKIIKTTKTKHFNKKKSTQRTATKKTQAKSHSTTQSNRNNTVEE